jgi:hypothetical protein
MILVNPVFVSMDRNFMAKYLNIFSFEQTRCDLLVLT